MSGFSHARWAIAAAGTSMRAARLGRAALRRSAPAPGRPAQLRQRATCAWAGQPAPSRWGGGPAGPRQRPAAAASASSAAAGPSAVLPESLLPLRGELGLTTAQAARLLEKHPELLCCTAASVREVLGFLRTGVGISRSQTLSAVVRAHPDLLTASTKQMEITLEAWRHAVASRKAADSMAQVAPHCLLMGPEAVEDRRRLFEGLGVAIDGLALRHPAALLQDAAATTAVFDFLVDGTQGPGMSRPQAARLCGSFPRLLTYDAQGQLAPLVRFLREELGADPASRACESFFAWPRVDAEYRPAARLLLECGYSREELAAEVDVLTYSLDLCLRPRASLVKRKELPRPALRSLAEGSDAEWCRAVGVDIEYFREFQALLRAEAKKAAASS
ncbi:unnamed protein product [Prorocentrum cordatum]|uniref:Uncharacterized protein n=1 Tax=Prorocentrum cordatum TaxID=2364126 RepID=A0ABN9WCC8_9DINO|nr:unnamed protein product [Polarella glacialis]